MGLRHLCNICGLVGLILAWTGTGCTSFNLGYDKIGDVLKNPGPYHGKQLRIKGKVTDVIKLPFIETKLYSVRDDTGEIQVRTSAVAPSIGTEVRVKGTLDAVAALGKNEIGLHLKEFERW